MKSATRENTGNTLVPVLLLLERTYPVKGGHCVWMEESYSRFACPVIMLTGRHPQAENRETHGSICRKRIKLDRYTFLRPESLGLYMNLLGQGAAILLRHRVGSIHCARSLPEGMVGVMLGKAFGRPSLIYAHGEEITTWGEKKQKWMFWAYRNCSRIIANSRFTRNLLLERGIAETKIEMIHPGVDLAVFRPGLDASGLRSSLGLDGKKVIFCMGRLTRRKGQDMLVRAMPAIVGRVPNVVCLIGGVGEMQEPLRGLIDECGVGQCVRLLGEIPAPQLPLYYNLCDVFVMPGRELPESRDTEGFGMVYMEASACGKPTVGGRVGGVGDAVLDGVTGLQVDGNSLPGIAEAVVKLLLDKELADRLARAGLERAQRDFDWQVIADRTSEITRQMSR